MAKSKIMLRKTDKEAKRLQVISLLKQEWGVMDIAKHTGVNRKTVARWRDEWKGEKVSAKTGEVVKVEKMDPILEGEAEIVCHDIADRMDKATSLHLDNVIDNVHKCTPSQSAVIVGICTDKARLLRGESTQNHAHLHLIGDLAAGDPE